MEINEVYKNKTLYFSPIGLQEKYGLNLIFTTATKGQIIKKSVFRRGNKMIYSIDFEDENGQK